MFNKISSSPKKTFAGVDVRELFFITLLIGTSIAFYRVLDTFVITIFLAGVAAFILKAPFNYLIAKFNLKKNWAAAVIIFLSLILITIPVVFIGIMVSTEAAEGYNHFQKNWPKIQKNIFENNYLDHLETLPYIGENLSKIQELDIGEKIGQTLSTALSFFAKTLQQAFVNTTIIIFHSLIALYLIYFLLIDGTVFYKKISDLIPLTNEDKNDLYERGIKVTKGTLYGTIMIGVGEGIFGGTLFTLFGIKAPFLWGCIMMILSMIPLVGTNSILLPVAIYFLLTEQYVSGVLLLVIGSGGILISQNIIRPKLVGDHSGIHPAIIVLSTLGGMAWLGLIGFLIGPLLASLFIAIWEQFGKKYRHKATALE